MSLMMDGGGGVSGDGTRNLRPHGSDVSERERTQGWRSEVRVPPPSGCAGEERGGVRWGGGERG